MNNLDKQYTDLLQDILDNGVKKKDRTGTGTISVFGRQIRHKMSEGFPLLTTKKMPFKTIVTELLWFLRGDTNIKYLVDNGCNIWNGDAYKNFMIKTGWRENRFKLWQHPNFNESLGTPQHVSIEEFVDRIKDDPKFAEKWGELGPVYGAQWRDWGGYTSNAHQKMNGESGVHIKGIDQIKNLIHDLKNNPDSRRLIVNAWNVNELDKMVLPPCHYGFQMYTRELDEDELYKMSPALKTINENKLICIKEQRYQDASILRTKEKEILKYIPTKAISLMWNQRSVDTFLGLPFNIASYALLLEIIAKEVNMIPDELIGNLGDVHLYLNHIEQAKEQIGREYSKEERTSLFLESGMDAIKDDLTRQIYFNDIPKRTREPYQLPTLNIMGWTSPENGHMRTRLIPTHLSSDEEVSYEIGDFTLSDYKSHPIIKAPLSN